MYNELNEQLELGFDPNTNRNLNRGATSRRRRRVARAALRPHRSSSGSEFSSVTCWRQPV